MKALLSALGYAILLLNCVSLSAETQQEDFQPVYATALVDEVNIRAGCGLNFEIIGQLNQVDEVIVIGQDYGWYKIKLPKEALCFVYQDYIDEGVVKANRLRLRAGGGLNFNVLGVLKKGEIVEVLEEKGNWLRIVPPANSSGWIKEDYLELTERKFIPPIPPVVEPSAQQNKIEAQGVINDLGKIFNRRGTHKLTKAEKVLYYLKSEAIDLNLYVYQKVQVKGIILEVEDSPYSVIDVQEILAGQ